jgi:uncharacterized membrane protein YhaH (DUF805 family)
MKIIESGKYFFTKAFDFKSRVSRSEYWWGYLIGFPIVFFALFPILVAILPQQIGTLVSWLISIPLISLMVRRLHDLNKSGWRVVLGVIPIIGNIIILIWMCRRGTPGSNSYGEDTLPPNIKLNP